MFILEALTFIGNFTFVLPEIGCYSCQDDNKDDISTCETIKFNCRTRREWEERGEPFWYFNFHQRIMELHLSVLMHSKKWTAIALNCRLGKGIWSFGASWKGQCEIGAVQQKFISPDELPVCLASLAASVACSKTCLKGDSSLSEVGSRWQGWMALIRPPYPPLSSVWPGYFRQDA